MTDYKVGNTYSVELTDFNGDFDLDFCSILQTTQVDKYDMTTFWFENGVRVRGDKSSVKLKDCTDIEDLFDD